MLKVEGDDVTAIEVAHCLNELDETLKMRQEDDFLSPTTITEMKKLIDDGYNSHEMAAIRNEFFGNFACFFPTYQRFYNNSILSYSCCTLLFENMDSSIRAIETICVGSFKRNTKME